MSNTILGNTFDQISNKMSRLLLKIPRKIARFS